MNLCQYQKLNCHLKLYNKINKICTDIIIDEVVMGATIINEHHNFFVKLVPVITDARTSVNSCFLITHDKKMQLVRTAVI